MEGFERYLEKKLQAGKGSRSYKITFSGSKKFGEGEHKIMKQLRALPPTTQIAIYGLDADLIILGISALVTH
jgi:5'-3' exonuclease